MNFRQENQTHAEIHEFPYFRGMFKTWISVKEIKSLQKFMNFRISVDMLKTWISAKRIKHIQKFMIFRISVDMLKTWICVKEIERQTESHYMPHKNESVENMANSRTICVLGLEATVCIMKEKETATLNLCLCVTGSSLCIRLCSAVSYSS